MADIEELIAIRLEKVKKLTNYGIKLHPERYEINHTLKEAMNLEDGSENIKVAGRIMAKRKMGKITFIDIQDIEGHIQCYITKNNIGEENYLIFHETVDIGDFIGVNGKIFTTPSGEKTIEVFEYVFLGKALRPLPEKFHGLTDQEMTYRERHLDLIMNEESRKRFL